MVCSGITSPIDLGVRVDERAKRAAKKFRVVPGLKAVHSYPLLPDSTASSSFLEAPDLCFPVDDYHFECPVQVSDEDLLRLLE